MRILLIDAKRPTELDTRYSPPLGLMYLASYLRERLSSQPEVKIVDTSLDNLSLDQIDKILSEFAPGIVGVRSVQIDADLLHAIGKRAKEYQRDCTVLAGGPYPTSEPDRVMKDTSFDYVVLGEGEETLAELVDKFSKGEDRSGVPGICFRENGEIRYTSPRPFIQDLDSIPYPAYDLVSLDSYTEKFNQAGLCRGRKYMNIFSSRGCPFRCIYCHDIFGKKIRFRSPRDVFNEMELLHKEYGVEEFHISDDSFNIDKKRAKKILDLIIKSDMEIKLAFPNGLRGDLMDHELVDKLVEAGTYMVAYGIETASPRLQKFIKKHINFRRIDEIIEYTCKKDIIVCGFFMLGFPTETEEEALQTVGYAQASPFNTAYFSIVTVQPGTELYQYALEHGYSPVDPKDLTHFQIKEGLYNFSSDRLIEIVTEAYRRFYFSKERILRNFEILPRFLSRRDLIHFYCTLYHSYLNSLEEIEDRSCRDQVRNLIYSSVP